MLLQHQVASSARTVISARQHAIAAKHDQSVLVCEAYQLAAAYRGIIRLLEAFSWQIRQRLLVVLCCAGLMALLLAQECICLHSISHTQQMVSQSC